MLEFEIGDSSEFGTHGQGKDYSPVSVNKPETPLKMKAYLADYKSYDKGSGLQTPTSAASVGILFNNNEKTKPSRSKKDLKG